MHNKPINVDEIIWGPLSLTALYKASDNKSGENDQLIDNNQIHKLDFLFFSIYE